MWRQTRCPSIGECLKKPWCIYTMEYYSAIKRNAFESALMRWTNLELIIQSEVSQKEKYKYCIWTYIWNLDGTDEFFFRAALEKQALENRAMDMVGGEEGEGERYGASNRNLQ